MPVAQRPRFVARLALVLGVLLFLIALRYTDWHLIVSSGRRLLVASALAIALSGAWHLTRTIAWAWCFERPRRVTFGRLFRVRIAAEAVSYVTLRGIAGEPLKVVLLADRVDARDATAAVALERLAYIIGTTLIVGVGSFVALVTVPLSPLWTRIFAGFTIGAAVTGMLTGMVLARGGSLLARLRRPPQDRSILAKTGRFVADVEDRLLLLAREDPSRLAVLTVATLVSYVAMALEAWAVLRAMNIPVSLSDALAIETFSRVASFASAPIPANLGALEAASLAAVAAVGRGGGAPLALVRRVRGLFWAAVGFLLYPRHSHPRQLVDPRIASRSRKTVPSTLLYVADDVRVPVSSLTRVASLPIAERVLRAAFRAGYTRAVVLDRTGALAAIGRTFGGRVQIAASDQAWQAALFDLPDEAVVTAIGPGTIVSTALFRDALTFTPDVDGVIDVPAGRDWPDSGVVRARVAATRDAPALATLLLSRSAADPSGDDVMNGIARLTVRVHDPADLPHAEHTLRRAVYKPTDATVARFNRRISLPISMCLLRTPITANHISVALVAIGFWSAWLFSRGHYAAGLLGAFLSLAASVLDGCDGEIARLKYQESALGCWLETFGDYSYYLAIFAGLTVGAVRQTQSPVFLWLGAASLSGTLVSFVLLIYLRGRITAGQPETLHVVARSRFRADPSWWSIAAWRLSFVATRSTMPYGIMALALLNLLPLFVVLSAVGANIYWVSLVLKLRHLLGTDASEPVAA